MQLAEADTETRNEWAVDRPAAGAVPEAAQAFTGGLTSGLLLASLNEGGFVIPARRELSVGLAASALVELALRGRVGADGRRLLVVDPAPTGDAVVDPVLELLATRRRAPDVGRCLDELSLDWTILGRAGQVLEARGEVHIERRALHPLIMHRFHPVPENRPAELRAQLRSTLEGARTAATPRDAVLASLAAAIGLLRAGGRGALPDLSPAIPTGPEALPASHAGGVLSAVHGALVSATRARQEAQAARMTASA